jgi:WD repeat-containing protein 61
MKNLKAEKIFSFTGHSGAIYSLEPGAEPHLFYSGSGDHLIAEWNLETHDDAVVISNLPGIVYSLKYYADKKLLFAGQSLGGIHVIDLSLKKESRFLAFHQQPVFDLLISEKYQLLISAGGDGNIHFISLNDFSLIKTISFGHQKVRCLILNPDEESVIAGCQDGSISKIDFKSLIIIHQWQAHKPGFSVNAALFISEGNLLLTGSRDACINIFDAKNNFSFMESIPAHNYAIYNLVMSPDKKYIASASRDKTVKIWDPDSMEVLLRIDQAGFSGHVNSVNRLLWSSFNSHLLSAGDDRSVLEWSMKIP